VTAASGSVARVTSLWP